MLLQCLARWCCGVCCTPRDRARYLNNADSCLGRLASQRWLVGCCLLDLASSVIMLYMYSLRGKVALVWFGSPGNRQIPFMWCGLAFLLVVKALVGSCAICLRKVTRTRWYLMSIVPGTIIALLLAVPVWLTRCQCRLNQDKQCNALDQFDVDFWTGSFASANFWGTSRYQCDFHASLPHSGHPAFHQRREEPSGRRLYSETCNEDDAKDYVDARGQNILELFTLNPESVSWEASQSSERIDIPTQTGDPLLHRLQIMRRDGEAQFPKVERSAVVDRMYACVFSYTCMAVSIEVGPNGDHVGFRTYSGNVIPILIAGNNPSSDAAWTKYWLQKNPFRASNVRGSKHRAENKCFLIRRIYLVAMIVHIVVGLLSMKCLFTFLGNRCKDAGSLTSSRQGGGRFSVRSLFTVGTSDSCLDSEADGGVIESDDSAEPADGQEGPESATRPRPPPTGGQLELAELTHDADSRG